MTDELVIPAPSDYHVHLRQAPVTRAVAPAHAWAGRVLVMPNTTPPVRYESEAMAYGVLCGTALPTADILTTIKLTTETTPRDVELAARAGVAAAKLYPAGVTTNSDDGIPADWLVNPVPQRFADVLGAMADCGLVLCCHGEMPGFPTFGSPAQPYRTRGVAFAWWVREMMFQFPTLRVVLEHVSARYEASVVEEWHHRAPGRIGATITPHHLVLTIDDVLGDRLRPHNFCKPVAKTEYDREFLVTAATSHPAFFLGTDSAPHPVGAKECADGCAGVFNAHAALGTVAEVFDKADALDKLAAFTSGNGDAFYRREPTVERRIRLVKKPYRVPHRFGWGDPNRCIAFQPWRAGETLAWSWEDVT